MILAINSAGYIACLICIFFSLRAANDAFKCYEKNVDHYAIAFLSASYLMMSGSLSGLDFDSEVTFKLLITAFMLITSKFCANHSEQLRGYCKLNFKKPIL